MRRMRCGLVVGALAVPVVFTGCELQKPTYTTGHLAPMSRSFESDVPVPIGFRFVETGSEDASTGAQRLYLRHRYVGSANKINVRNFYREQMPLARWVKQSDGHVNGEYTLRFDKGRETCSVSIRDNHRRRGETEVQVIIIPKPPGRTGP